MSANWHDRFQSQQDRAQTLRTMTRDDIRGAAAVTRGLGWVTDEPGWLRLYELSPSGCFVVDEEDRGIVGAVTTTAYGTSLAWIGMMVIDPERQRRGLGRMLLRAALDHLIAQGSERIMLDATAVGRPLYEQLGFRTVGRVERWEGRASTYLGTRAERLSPDCLPELLEFDAAMFGAPRGELLRQQIDTYGDLGWVDWTREGIEGYLLGRTQRDGVNLGPWLARSTASAERLIRAALEQLQGQSVTVNVPDDNTRAVVLAHNHNLKRVRHCTRMIYRDAQPLRREPLVEYAVGSLATG